MKTKTAKSLSVEIFVAGDANEAERICREYCLRVGLCVTVTSTKYIYTGGCEDGVVVGLRAYPRFPNTDIEHHANELAKALMAGLFQWSAMVVGPVETVWITTRDGV